MITWTIESLEYTNEYSEYPKLVNFIHLKAKHSAGPVHYTCFQVPLPSEGHTYVAFDDITKEWAVNLWRSIDASNGSGVEAYLNELADSTERGQELPWT
jgi:hypothetical protein